MPFAIQSPAFEHNAEIPSKYTCDGEGICPPLIWSDPPQNTVTYVLIIDDPDAPDPKAPKRTWVHWVVYNIPASTRQLPEGVSEATLPKGASTGINDSHTTSFDPPAPPIGRHRYIFKLYALSEPLSGLENHPTKKEVEEAMKNSIVGRAELVGTYQRRRG